MDSFLAHVQGVVARQQDVAPLHPLFNRLWPVAVASRGELYVYVPEPRRNRYELIRVCPSPVSLPDNVAAAFALDALDGRIACVVGTRGIGTDPWYVTVFHEFVHCHQFESGELELKRRLSIANREDPMWELQYPFPYADGGFAARFAAYVAALEREEESAPAFRRALLSHLPRGSGEYLVWQEWKEGLARLMENRVRQRWRLPVNRGGRTPPYSRVSFYHSGSLYIAQMTSRDPTRSDSLEGLFQRMWSDLEA